MEVKEMRKKKRGTKKKEKRIRYKLKRKTKEANEDRKWETRQNQDEE